MLLFHLETLFLQTESFMLQLQDGGERRDAVAGMHPSAASRTVIAGKDKSGTTEWAKGQNFCY